MFYVAFVINSIFTPVTRVEALRTTFHGGGIGGNTQYNTSKMLFITAFKKHRITIKSLACDE